MTRSSDGGQRSPFWLRLVRAREGLAAPARLARQRPLSPLRLRLVRVGRGLFKFSPYAGPGSPTRHVFSVRHIVFALAACFVLSLSSPLSAQRDEISWFDKYGDAIQEAKRTGKPIFLEFRCEA